MAQSHYIYTQLILGVERVQPISLIRQYKRIYQLSQLKSQNKIKTWLIN